MRQHLVKAVMLSSITAALPGVALSQTVGVTFYPGDCARSNGPFGCADMSGGGSLEFSDLLMGALNVASIDVSAVMPAVLIDGEVMSVAAPIQTLKGVVNMEAEQFTATQISILGGTVMTASGLLPSGKRNASSTGGSLSLTDIRVDLLNEGIYATLTGANGVGTRNDQLIWKYGAIEGPTTLALGYAVSHMDNRLSELTITTEAFELFAQSLGLTTFGRRSMADISDYGVMNSAIDLQWSLAHATSNLPEPSAYVTMGLGLVGLAVAARRGRARKA